MVQVICYPEESNTCSCPAASLIAGFSLYRRVDELLVTEAWGKQKEIAAREGVVAIAYERKYGQYSRIYQMAKLMLWSGGAGLYSCPIAMTGKKA